MRNKEDNQLNKHLGKHLSSPSQGPSSVQRAVLLLPTSPLVLLKVTLSPFGDAMGSAGGWGQCAAGFVCHSCFSLFSFTAPSLLLISSALAWIRPWAAVPSEASLPWRGLSRGHSSLRGVPLLVSPFVCPAPPFSSVLPQLLPPFLKPGWRDGTSSCSNWLQCWCTMGKQTQLSPARALPGLLPYRALCSPVLPKSCQIYPWHV